MLALGVLIAGGAVAPAVAQSNEKSRQEVRKQGHKERGTRKSPKERAKARAERMTRELDLNKSQARKVEALCLQHAKDKDAMRARFKKGDKRDASFRKEMMDSHKRHNEAMKEILNKKQYAKYEEQREQMKARHKERADSGKRGHHAREAAQSR